MYAFYLMHSLIYILGMRYKLILLIWSRNSHRFTYIQVYCIYVFILWVSTCRLVELLELWRNRFASFRIRPFIRKYLLKPWYSFDLLVMYEPLVWYFPKFTYTKTLREKINKSWIASLIFIGSFLFLIVRWFSTLPSSVSSLSSHQGFTPMSYYKADREILACLLLWIWRAKNVKAKQSLASTDLRKYTHTR